MGMKFTTERISRRVQTMAVSAIKEMSLLAMETPGAINLAWGLPSFETPEYIRRRIASELLTDPEIGKYAPPPGLPALKTKLAERLAAQKGIEVDPAREMIITAGGMQGLMMTWMTILEPDDEVLITSPGFSSHYEQVGLAGGVAVPVPLVEEQGWKLDVAAFRRAVTPRTKAMVIVNPCNPTGTLFPRESLVELGRIALENGLYVVTDDPYQVFTFDGREAFDLRTLPELRGNTISCYSFSKEYAMTGWRVGWLLADEGIINQMLKVQDAFVICAPRVSQLAALHALDGGFEPTQKMIDELAVRRELICRRLDALPGLFSYVKPQGAYYIFPKIVPADLQDSVDFCVRLLKETGVVAVPGIAFGPTGEGHVRMSFCFTREEIDAAFDRIDRWWRGR
jgi:aminotransferase